MPHMYDPARNMSRREHRARFDILSRLTPYRPADHGLSELSGNLPARDEDEISAAYREHYPLLAFLAFRRFRVPDDEVRPIIHEIFVALIRNRSKVHDIRAWLVAAMCNRCRLYWRSRGREDVALRGFGNDEADDTDHLAARLDLVKALRHLNPKCREVLRLRFVDALSSAAIAERYETTVAYARKMVYRCAEAARDFFSSTARSA